MITLRSHQLPRIEELKTILSDSDYAYLEMPTGTGKTITALMFAKSITKANEKIVFVCPRITLVGQTEEAAKACKIKNIEVTTWQAYSNKEEVETNVSVLIMDEFHFGGLDAADNKSFKKCLKIANARKRLYVSATLIGINEDLFGKREGKTARYLENDALVEGFVNPTLLKCYHSGLTLKIAQLEEQISSELGVDISETDIKQVVKKCKDKGVAVKCAESLRSLRYHRLEALVDLYLKKENGNQALFFCSSVEQAKDGVKLLNKKAGKNIAVVSHGSLDSAECRDIETKFKTGAIKVVFNCNKYCEGFDFPALEVAFDVAFSHKNYRRFKQKAGRITRTTDSKEPSRFYYAVDVSYFTRQGSKTDCVPSEEYKAKVKEMHPEASEGDLPFIEQAGLVALKSQAEVLGNNAEVAMVKTELERVTGYDGEVVTLSTTSTLYIAEASGMKFNCSIDLFSALTSRSDMVDIRVQEKKAELLDYAKNHEDRPISTSRLGMSLNNYIYTASDCYDPIFTRNILDIRPLWEIVKSDVVARTSDESEELVKNYVDKYGYLPSQKDKNKEVARLGVYINHKRKIDKDFFRHVLSKQDLLNQQNVKEIRQYVNVNGYLPSKCDDDVSVKRLGILLEGMRQGDSGQDIKKDMDDYCVNVPDMREARSNATFNEIKEYCKINGYRPSKHDSDPKIKKLGVNCTYYTSKSSDGYSKEKADYLEQIPTWQEFKKSQNNKDGV